MNGGLRGVGKSPATELRKRKVDTPIPDRRTSRTPVVEVVGITLFALGQALWIRVLRRPELLKLPAVARPRPLPAEALESTIVTVERLVRVLVFWRRARCFYRACAIAAVFRHRGYPIVVNFGFNRQGSKKGRSRMHCWLTLDGSLFYEPEVTASDFPIPMGSSGQGISYWTADSGGASERS